MCRVRSPEAPTTTSDGRCSVFVQAELEAHSYKWILSEHERRDVGDWALADWCHRHWRGFLRRCVMEHLEGKTFWEELDRGDFGLLAVEEDTPHHVEDIVWRLRHGWENLDFCLWFLSDPDVDRAEVRKLLERVNINDRRLGCPFTGMHSRAG